MTPVTSGLECTLREAELRVWARVINTLCALGGDDVHVLFTRTSLSLTTYDASLTSHTTMAFNCSFFTSYEFEDDAGSLECKVPTKCIRKPFCTMRFMTKCASECRIQFDRNSDTLNVTLGTKFGAQIQYKLRILANTELLEIDFEIDSLTSVLTCDAKFLLGTLANFHQGKSCGDLTLKVAGSEVRLKNSNTDLVKKEGKIYTELALRDVDFMEFNVQEDCQLTFSFRDFKILVQFAETMKLPVSIKFHNESKPVIALVSNTHPVYEARLMLANRRAALETAQPPDTELRAENGLATDIIDSAVTNEHSSTQGSVSLLEPSSPIFSRSHPRNTTEIPEIPRAISSASRTMIETASGGGVKSNFRIDFQDIEIPRSVKSPAHVLNKRPALMFPNAGRQPQSTPPRRTVSNHSSLVLFTDSDTDED